uniref:Uncharacterized protein n=1 Tax=Eutreptiella gymnastica TaxID=73025 RepID=A0A7S4FUR8_9EUGL
MQPLLKPPFSGPVPLQRIPVGRGQAHWAQACARLRYADDGVQCCFRWHAAVDFWLLGSMDEWVQCRSAGWSVRSPPMFFFCCLHLEARDGDRHTGTDGDPPEAARN